MAALEPSIKFPKAEAGKVSTVSQSPWEEQGSESGGDGRRGSGTSWRTDMAGGS